MTLADIVDLARAYAKARSAVQEVVDDVLEQQRKIVRAKLRSLKARNSRMAAAREALEEAIEANPTLFARPRTKTIEGIRFGMRSAQGEIEHGDIMELVQAIYLELPPEVARLLVQKKVTVSAEALRKLEPEQLDKIAVTIGSKSDKVMISAPDSALEAMLTGMLKDEKAAA